MTKTRHTEAEISEAVLRVLATAHGGEATQSYIRKRIPGILALTAGDRQPSETRAGEELWEQIVRNIKSHQKSDGNYIALGYLTAPSRGRLRITVAGRQHII